MSDTKNPPLIQNLKNMNLPPIKPNYNKKTTTKTFKKSPDIPSKLNKSTVNKTIVVNKKPYLTNINGRNQNKHLISGATYKPSFKISKKINTGLDLSQRSNKTHKIDNENNSIINNDSEIIPNKDQKIPIKNNNPPKKLHTEQKKCKT